MIAPVVKPTEEKIQGGSHIWYERQCWKKYSTCFSLSSAGRSGRRRCSIAVGTARWHPLPRSNPSLSLLVALRPSGLCAGEFTAPDAFDAPLPIRYMLNAFEGT